MRAQTIVRTLAVATLLGTFPTTSAFAADFNPQPDPPGRYRTATGTEVVLGADHRVFTIRDGKPIYLPPGPCKLANGKTLVIGQNGKLVQSIGSTTGGAGAGKLR